MPALGGPPPRAIYDLGAPAQYMMGEQVWRGFRSGCNCIL